MCEEPQFRPMCVKRACVQSPGRALPELAGSRVGEGQQAEAAKLQSQRRGGEVKRKKE